jgi:hypothetical protein
MRSGNISFAEVLPKWEVLSRKATTAKSVSATLCNAPALLPVLGQRYEEKILLACSLCQKQFKIGPYIERLSKRHFRLEADINEH